MGGFPLHFFITRYTCQGMFPQNLSFAEMTHVSKIIIRTSYIPYMEGNLYTYKSAFMASGAFYCIFQFAMYSVLFYIMSCQLKNAYFLRNSRFLQNFRDSFNRRHQLYFHFLEQSFVRVSFELLFVQEYVLWINIGLELEIINL